MKKKVLFLCTHNSARSQMAEGLLRARYGDRYESFSAGTEPGKLNPYVVRAMAEIGIDISGHWSKSLNEFLRDEFDYVVTVCDSAKEGCPYFPGGKKLLHESFPDPSGFTGTDEEIMAGVRTVRDQIQQWITETFGVGKQ
ncbi:low molecular weight phosphotyrosine protein phosphatase [Lucifera butyrica]|uniref:Low molecular weight phosphotyrosine protein phosphatase n=1 Tax=Lucifera butyrica TaxID=1351585 RepID=A0A498R8F0_9FIRM|nr:arsenate reductase ArsC [Lucifera butyrica]VBB06453.1 low molecular weight phosphotyrosine protein phosphatase [Lucifera butyrica]